MRKILVCQLKNKAHNKSGKNKFIIYVDIDYIEDADIDELEKVRQQDAIKQVAQKNIKENGKFVSSQS
jgi:hypothetical protein